MIKCMGTRFPGSPVQESKCLACAKDHKNDCGYDYALLRALYTDKERTGIHVTDLLGCMQRSYWNKTAPLPEYPYERLTRVIGTLTHSIVESKTQDPVSEMPLDAMGIVGTCDLYYLSGRVVDFKCQPAGELVTMADGTEKPIEELVIFDEVLSSDLKPHRVTGIVDGGVQEVVELRIASGQVIRVSKNHPVWAYKRLQHNTAIGRRSAEWIDAGDLSIGDNIFQLRSWTGSESTNPDDARLIGYLVGDGGLTQKYGVRFTNSDEDILSDVHEICVSHGWDFTKANRHYDWRITNQGRKRSATGVKAFVKRFGLHGKGAHDKFVPSEIMQGNFKTIANFLAGYFDADGGITKPDGKAPPRVTITTVSTQLAYQTCELLRRIGINCRVYRAPISYHICVWQAASILRFFDVLPTRCTAKRSRFEGWRERLESTGARGGKRIDRIDSISDLGQMQTIGIEVEGNHTYFTSGILTHNTTRWMMPSKLPYSSHALQVNVYGRLLQKMGRDVTSLAVQYIDMSGPTKCRKCKVPMVPSVEPWPGGNEVVAIICPHCGNTPKNAHLGAMMVEIPMEDPKELDKIIIERRDTLDEALLDKVCPSAEPTFLCKGYCAYLYQCPEGQAFVGNS